MNNFTYNIPTKVYFGTDQLQHLGEELRRYGKNVLLTYGGGSVKKTGLYDRVVSEIKAAGLTLFELGGIDPNPRVSSVNEGAKLCRAHKIDVLLAVGGGSVIDCTKYIGAATYYNGDAWDILLGNVDVAQCLPIVTVLTLSATGSEMNCGGVISNLETNDKIGRLFPPMLPKASFLDPTNTYTVSAYQTACGAADILSHVLEVYFAPEKDLYLLDTVMEGLMKTVIKYAPIAIENPEDYEARANLMWASSWAINGFVNGGKQHEWSCHPMEHQLSAYYDITHGLGLAILTPRWMEYCLNESTASKFYQFGVNVFGLDPASDQMAVAMHAIRALSEFFFRVMGLKSTLAELNIDDTHFAEMAEKAVDKSKIDGFRTLNATDVEAIYRMCLK